MAATKKDTKDPASEEAITTPEAKDTTPAPAAIDPRAVLAEMVKQRDREAEARERVKLGPAHIAKIGRQRLALARQRGGGRALNHALALNAADLGMKVEEYREMFGGEG